MKHAWWVGMFLTVVSPAFADYQATPGKRVDPIEMTSEFKQAVPSLEGCDYAQDGSLTCRRLTGDFTAAEKVALDAALAVHDPDKRAKQNLKKEQDKSAGIAALKTGTPLTDDQLKALGLE